jgi:hypothetical protein
MAIAGDGSACASVTDPNASNKTVKKTKYAVRFFASHMSASHGIFMLSCSGLHAPGAASRLFRFARLAAIVKA